MTQNFIFLWLGEPENLSAVRATNSNAAQPGINQDGVNGLELILNKKELMLQFDFAVESMLALIINLAKQNQNLHRTRNLLLPRLISGQIPFNEKTSVA